MLTKSGLGHEGLNNHDRLHNDPLIQTVAGRIQRLASSSTFYRFEASVTHKEIVALNQVLLEQFNTNCFRIVLSAP
ncbi:transposase [Orrella sp. 11846]|uniref:transposase n=1 Tax=Orrella sp. 11846 TaxID=3409913 RepID=UPI003B591E82